MASIADALVSRKHTRSRWAPAGAAADRGAACSRPEGPDLRAVRAQGGGFGNGDGRGEAGHSRAPWLFTRVGGARQGAHAGSRVPHPRRTAGVHSLKIRGDSTAAPFFLIHP